MVALSHFRIHFDEIITHYSGNYLKNTAFESQISGVRKSVLEMGRYTIPELLSVPEFHTGTYQYIGLLYIFIFSHFSDGISLFRF
jgi:hypothetical protein